MKRALILLALLCSGCVPASTRDLPVPPPPFVSNARLDVFIDKDNGCQYIGWEPSGARAGAITPRMAADGKQVCRQGAKP